MVPVSLQLHVRWNHPTAYLLPLLSLLRIFPSRHFPKRFVEILMLQKMRIHTNTIVKHLIVHLVLGLKFGTLRRRAIHMVRAGHDL